MTLVVKNCQPALFSCEGGGLATVTGVLPNAPLALYLQPLGASGDTGRVAMYSGIAGQGNVVNPLGVSARAIFPKVSVAVPQWRLVVVCPSTGDSGVCPVTLQARTPFYDTTTYALRSLYSPMWATGPRSLTDQVYPWAP